VPLTRRIDLPRYHAHYFFDVENLNLEGPSFLSLFPAWWDNRLPKGGLPSLASNLVCLASSGRC